MRPYLPIIGCPEMNHITITDSYYALVCYRCGNILFLPDKTVTFQPLPSDFTVGPYSRRILFYTLARPCLRSLRHSILSRSFLHFERLQFIISRDFTSLLLRFQLNVMSDSFSILIIQPAVYFYRRSDLTEDSLDVSFFNLPFCPQTSPSILTLRDFVAASPVHSYGAYATFLFFTLDSFITRDYTSLLREITLHCYERLQIIITRDYKSLLLGLYFIVTRITLHYYERLL